MRISDWSSDVCSSDLLDADDGFAPDRLARLVALGEARGADVVVDHLSLVTAKGRVLGEALPPQDPLFVEALTAAGFVRRNNFPTAGFKPAYLTTWTSVVSGERL